MKGSVGTTDYNRPEDESKRHTDHAMPIRRIAHTYKSRKSLSFDRSLHLLQNVQLNASMIILYHLLN